MGLFSKFDQPIFLKETSDTDDYIMKLQSISNKMVAGPNKERLEREIKLAQIGKVGEDNVAFELKNAAMPMYVLRDVHFETNGLSAQVDFIVITRKLTFLVECKNLIGNIEIDSNGNFIREYEIGGKKVKEGIYSPITQNKRHLDVLLQLKKDQSSNVIKRAIIDKVFFNTHKSIVVLANPKTVLNARFAKKEVKDQVIRADQLISYIKKQISESKELAFNDKEMLDFTERLLGFHTPNQSDYSKKYEHFLNDLVETEPVSKLEYTPAIEIHIDELIKNLKAYRLTTSRKENIKPYLIFNDNQMEDLINKMPKSKVELLRVNGFAEAKVEKYGDEILKILNE